MAPSQRSLKSFLFPAVNILAAILLLTGFLIAGQSVAQTFIVAKMTSLNNLKPNQIDYLWELNIRHAPVDPNKIRCFADYYEHLIEVFPEIREAYGVLGYCYHYLNDDPKAIKFLKLAVQNNPDYFWNYYDLSVIYISESRYQEALEWMQKALKVDPKNSFKRMISSPWVYEPLLGTDGKEIYLYTAKHLQAQYQYGFLLEQLLMHMEYGKNAREILSKLHPEIYAF